MYCVLFDCVNAALYSSIQCKRTYRVSLSICKYILDREINIEIFLLGKMNVRVTKGVSAELLQYYENMTTAILGNDETLVKVNCD